MERRTLLKSLLAPLSALIPTIAPKQKLFAWVHEWETRPFPPETRIVYYADWAYWKTFWKKPLPPCFAKGDFLGYNRAEKMPPEDPNWDRVPITVEEFVAHQRKSYPHDKFYPVYQ
jgi:hypothetical protein